jgi:hypothetical protein
LFFWRFPERSGRGGAAGCRRIKGELADALFFGAQAPGLFEIPIPQALFPSGSRLGERGEIVGLALKLVDCGFYGRRDRNGPRLLSPLKKGATQKGRGTSGT